MSNDDDECDSSRALTMADESDVDAFLRNESEKKISSKSQVDEIGEKSSFLSKSCFASISDELTELNWLNNFHFKQDLSSDKTDRRTFELKNKLKNFDFRSKKIDESSIDVRLFVGFYSKRDEAPTAWSLTLKQCYDLIENFVEFTKTRIDWKNFVKKTLLETSCFVQIKDPNGKARSLWSVDQFYRSTLTRAISKNKTFQETNFDSTNVQIEEKSTAPITSNEKIPEKLIVKAKAFPRLFERLYEQEQNVSSRTFSPTKRTRSASLVETSSEFLNENRHNKSLASSWNEPSIKRLNGNHSQSSINKSTKLTTRKRSNDEHSYANKTSPSHFLLPAHFHQVLPVKKRFSSNSTATHRANTRISRRFIEQDLKLMRENDKETSTVE